MTAERMNSASGRATRKELIHIDDFSDKRKEGFVTFSPGSFEYKDVSCYTVWHDGKLMFRERCLMNT
eukprot:3504769-Amphidinium_carterae.1